MLCQTNLNALGELLIEMCYDVYQDGFLKSTHALRAQKCVSKRIISRNTAPLVQFLAPIRSATAGRALTRRPFADRVGNRRVTDDFVSQALSPALWEGVSKSEKPR